MRQKGTAKNINFPVKVFRIELKARISSFFQLKYRQGKPPDPAALGAGKEEPAAHKEATDSATARPPDMLPLGGGSLREREKRRQDEKNDHRTNSHDRNLPLVKV